MSTLKLTHGRVLVYLVARIRVVNCGSMVLCRTLTVAQCLTINLAVTATLMSSRSRIFGVCDDGVGRFGAVMFGWRFLQVGKRTEGFATSKGPCPSSSSLPSPFV